MSLVDPRDWPSKASWLAEQAVRLKGLESLSSAQETSRRLLACSHMIPQVRLNDRPADQHCTQSWSQSLYLHIFQVLTSGRQDSS